MTGSRALFFDTIIICKVYSKIIKASKGLNFFGHMVFSALQFLALWDNISALLFSLFQPTGLGPPTQTQGYLPNVTALLNQSCLKSIKKYHL